MPEDLESLTNIGAVALVFLLFIREFFAYLRSNGEGKLNSGILKELQLMNNNHLHTIQDVIERGNRELTKTIHDDNLEIIRALGEIRGVLSRK